MAPAQIRAGNKYNTVHSEATLGAKTVETKLLLKNLHDSNGILWVRRG